MLSNTNSLTGIRFNYCIIFSRYDCTPSGVLFIPTARFLSCLQRALADLRNGQPVLLMDDFDRENEADLIIAAEKITTESMARLIRDCSGIVCLCLTDERLQQLDLPPMVAANGSRFGTAFTVTIEAKHGVTTGVSAADRVTTIKAAIADGAVPGDPGVSPGMFFLCGQCLAEYYSGAVIPRVLWIWCVWLECRRQRYYAN